MRLPRLELPSLGRDAMLLVAAIGIFALSFMGVSSLLKVLYVLRLGYGPEFIGIYGSVSALTYMVMGLPSGMLGERYGSRAVMLTGGAIMVLGQPLVPLTELVPAPAQAAWLIFTQVPLTIGWSMLTVSLVPALMAATTATDRSRGYAASVALRSFGTLLGTVLGGVLPDFFAAAFQQTTASPAPYAAGLWTGAALALIGLAPLWLVREVKPVVVAEAAVPHEPFPAAAVARLAVHAFLAHAGWATCAAFCNPYMDSELHLSTSLIGLITGAAQLAALGSAFLVPRLSARFGHLPTLVVASLGMSIGLAPLGLLPLWGAASLGRIAVFGMDAFWMPTLQMYQMEQVAARWRSRAFGVTSMALGFAYASTSLGGGFLIAAAGYRSIFIVGMGLCLAATPIVRGIQSRASASRESAGSLH